MTMAWALTELLRQPDAAAAATEKLDRIVISTGGGEAGDAGRDSQRRPAPTLVAHAAATPWPAPPPLHWRAPDPQSPVAQVNLPVAGSSEQSVRAHMRPD